MLISYAFTGKLICAFAFAYADCFFFFFFLFFLFFFVFFSYAAAHYHKISVDYHKISLYFLNLNRFLSNQNAKRSKPQYKGSIVVHHSVKKAATHIVTSHTARGTSYVRSWSKIRRSLVSAYQVNSKSLYSLMQGKTRKKQYYTQVARQ